MPMEEIKDKKSANDKNPTNSLPSKMKRLLLRFQLAATAPSVLAEDNSSAAKSVPVPKSRATEGSAWEKTPLLPDLSNAKQEYGSVSTHNDDEAPSPQHGNN